MFAYLFSPDGWFPLGAGLALGILAVGYHAPRRRRIAPVVVDPEEEVEDETDLGDPVG
jgi:hypothetical protein